MYDLPIQFYHYMKDSTIIQTFKIPVNPNQSQDILPIIMYPYQTYIEIGRGN